MRTVNEYAADVKRHYIEACEAVLGRGGNIPSGMGIADLPLAISQIPHDVTLAYHTAESTTMRTKVPSNVEKYARINRIGGMTYKCNNLIPFPYLDGINKTVNGITFTVNADRSITVSGTATGSASFYFHEGDLGIPAGKTITISGGVAASGSNGKVVVNIRRYLADGTDSSFIESPGTYSNPTTKALAEGEKIARVGIYIAPGLTVNATVYPMLNYGETALPYEPYFEGLRNASVTALKSEGVNLLNMSALCNENLIDNGDGTYTFTRTNAEWTGRFAGNADIKLPKGIYVSFDCDIIAHTGNIKHIGIQIFDANNNLVASNAFVGSLRSALLKGDSARMTMYVDSTAAVGDYITIANPQITYGYLTEYPYKPYIGEIDKVEIPEAVRSLPDYGCGVEGYRNTVEWREDGRCYYVRRVKRYAVKGTETWYQENTAVEGFYRFFFYFSPATFLIDAGELSPVICNMYEGATAHETWRGKEGVFVTQINSGASRFYIATAKFTELDTLKAHFAELYAAGNPLVFDYALETPIETDITDLMRDNFIAVEGDGTITAVNEHGYDAETSLTYLINTVGG